METNYSKEKPGTKVNIGCKSLFFIGLIILGILLFIIVSVLFGSNLTQNEISVFDESVIQTYENGERMGLGQFSETETYSSIQSEKSPEELAYKDQGTNKKFVNGEIRFEAYTPENEKDPECIRESVIENAYSGTYEVIDSHVCFDGKVIAGADVDSFFPSNRKGFFTGALVTLDGLYDAFDKYAYYQNGKRIHSIDDGGYELLNNERDYYLRIENSMYYVEPINFEEYILSFITSYTDFELLGMGYSRGGHTIYYHADEVESVVHLPDLTEFSVSSREYQVEGIQRSLGFGFYEGEVYFKNYVLVGLSPDSMNMREDGRVLYDEDTAWGMTGCSTLNFKQIDYDQIDTWDNC